MKSKILILFLISCYLTNCKLGTTESVSNADIDSILREEINLLDKQVVSSIVDNDINKLKSLMSPKLLEVSDNEIDELINNVSSLYQHKDYEVIDQFYIENSTSGLGNTLFSGIEGDDNYSIKIISFNEKIFISLLLPKGNIDRYYILNAYGKYPEGWKLNIIQFGAYTKNGKTAPQLFSQAKEEYNKGHLVDATNTMYLNSKVLKPSKSFTYINEENMITFFQKLITEFKTSHEFPIQLSGIASEPAILNISLQSINEGHFPMVEYLTKIDLKDTTATRLENESIQQEIGTIFKGIDKDKKYVFYKAFSQIPDGQRKVPTYGFIQKIN